MITAVTGASGFVGGRLAQMLTAQPGCEVRALIRRGKPPQFADGARAVIVRGDLADASILAQLLAPGCTVANLAYDAQASAQANLTAAGALAEACLKYGVRRLVHCSTAVVAGRARAQSIDETTQCRPLANYEKTKLAIEDLLRMKARGNFELAILRPTAVFGPGGRNLLKLAHDLSQGPRLANYLRSCINDRRRMHLAGVENVIAAAAFLLETQARVDQEVFIISDDDAPENNFRDVEHYLMRAFRIPDYVLPRVTLPGAILSMLLRLRGRSLIGPDTVFASRKLEHLGFRKPVKFATSLAIFVEWYRSALASETRPG